jgi:RHS repeat-associated protein
VQDGRGTTTLAYESGNDRVASVTDPVTGTVSYTYSLAGERLTTSLPGGGTWNYLYDYSGVMGGVQRILPKDEPDSVTTMLRRITDDQSRQVDYYSDHYGKLHRTRGNYSFDQYGGLASYLETKYTYGSGTGWTTQVQNQWLSKNMYGYWQTKVLVQNDYTYATTGNRLTNALSDWTGPLRTEQYGYDELSRLTSVNYGDGQTQGYTFDPMGNRLTKTDNVTGNETYGYNAANMLTARNGAAYTNDNNGNTLTGGGRTNTWDGQNRLTQCVYNGTTTTHTYAADGLRRRTVQGANTTDYVLEGQSVVRTLLNSTVDRTYLHGLRGPEYERVGTGAPSWYLYDGLGSVLGTVDQNGNVVSARKFDVYGAVRSVTGSSGSKHKCVGGLGHPSEDETGLVYMRARYMDPALGRFVNEDAAQDGRNWFTYASNSPACRADADGRADDPIGIIQTLATADWDKIKQGWEFIRMGARLMRFSTREFAKQIIADMRAMRYGPYSQKDQAEGLSHSVSGLAALREGLTLAAFGMALIYDGLFGNPTP